ncbi:hypothetical protein CIPAW_12G075700 [Carya illinoinensis]|uniref:Uncharacterized protein n=1 Tax=Carya illinoinensis TaxID=32201 RepID=A0A8T1NW16_CARIL|nr:hypothetical protein CIPAW_12G075700 [Carya illinoinensis]
MFLAFGQIAAVCLCARAMFRGVRVIFDAQQMLEEMNLKGKVTRIRFYIYT